MMWWNGDGHTHWGWMTFGAISMVVFWGAIILFAVWAIKALSRPGERDTHRDARQILDERFAKGEITQQQYDDMKKALKA